MNTREVLLLLSYKYEGDWEKIYKSIREKDPVDETELKDIYANMKGNFITILDENYPSCLKNIFRPPFVIYYYGNINLLQSKKTISVIGSRDNTQYGEKMTKTIVSDLVKENFVIVSGLARGIDSIAHKTALICGGMTIGVLGSGIDNMYPSSNRDLYDVMKKEGLVISEYPSMCPPKKENFPLRNRLVASSCSGIILIEGKAHSGTLITIKYGLENGKNIYCVPRNADEDSISNNLIKDGASLITCAKDIIDDNL